MDMLHIVDHPIVSHNLTIMRDAATTSAEFRSRLRTIAALLAYEASRDLPVRTASVTTPVSTASLPMLDQRPITVVPILRAGMGMVDGVLAMLPHAAVGFIGMERDETTFQPMEYYCKMPANVADSLVYVIDPRLATGGSAADALTRLKERGCQDLRMLCIVAAPEGVRALQQTHPDVAIYTASLDDGLTETAYITPGLGDAGDRIFATVV